MVAESGAVLLDDEARAAIVGELLPLATVITPNLPEARVLAGGDDHDDVEDLARALHALGPANVVVTGGHRDEVTDVFFDGTTFTYLPATPCRRRGARFGLHALERAGRPPGARLCPLEAARAARAIASDAVRDGLGIGAGPGPVNALGITARSPAEAEPAATGRRSATGGVT